MNRVVGPKRTSMTWLNPSRKRTINWHEWDPLLTSSDDLTCLCLLFSFFSAIARITSRLLEITSSYGFVAKSQRMLLSLCSYAGWSSDDVSSVSAERSSTGSHWSSEIGPARMYSSEFSDAIEDEYCQRLSSRDYRDRDVETYCISPVRSSASCWMRYAHRLARHENDRCSNDEHGNHGFSLSRLDAVRHRGPTWIDAGHVRLESARDQWFFSYLSRRRIWNSDSLWSAEVENTWKNIKAEQERSKLDTTTVSIESKTRGSAAD